MPVSKLSHTRECTTCDVCGDRVTVPPGVEYDGMVLCKGHARELVKRRRTTEILSPYLAEVERELRERLDV